MSSEGSIGARNNEATANSQAEPILSKKQAQTRSDQNPVRELVCMEKDERELRSPMSAIGTKRTSLVAMHMSAFGCKADMALCTAHVCF